MKGKAGRSSAVMLLAGILAISLACSKAPDDGQLTGQIQARLSEDSGLHGKAITVQTSGGVVTLSGIVDNDTQRAAASRYASAFPGVKEVVNNLQTPSGTLAATGTNRTPAPSPEKSMAKPSSAAIPSSAKPRPEAPRHGTKPDSVEISEDAPSPPSDTTASADPAPDETPAPTRTTPPPPPAPKNVTVPSGTAMAIRLLDPIDSEQAQVGQTFRATLDAPLQSDADSAVPSGYDVKGHIEDVKSAGKFAGKPLLVLQLDSISVGGKSYNIDSDSYRREGANRTTDTAKKVGVGAALGAIIGGIAGGGKGAGIGAAAGGGVGGGVQAASKGKPIQLPSETVLTFTLRSPLTVILVDKGRDSGRQRLETAQ